MKHVTKIVSGGRSRSYPHYGCFDVFCTCWEFWINPDPEAAQILAESHKRIANAHDEQLERDGTCIHGGRQG
jgi:hypothetical protein